MSKRRGDDNQSESQGKRSRPAPKKHLYLVLDDWEKGYSIHKIDRDTLLSDSDESTCTDVDPRHLPEVAALRFVASIDMHFVAMGSNIVIVNGSGETPSLVYDTGAAALAIGPHLPGHLSGLIAAMAAGGDMLYALTTFGAHLPLSFEVFSWAPCTRDTYEPGRPTHEWSWKSLPAPPPPFNKEETIASYAVHPDGRTIFVSTCDANDSHGGKGTYSFDTKHCEWRWHGEWELPFQGQGYFDRELDAWIGLHKEQGYICFCQVASRRKATTQPDSGKVEEKLFCNGEKDKHLGATLAYMGESKFCLVESVVREDVELAYACDGCMVHVTMFGLKFNRKGKLQTMSHHTTYSFAVSKYVSSFSPVAFWM